MYTQKTIQKKSSYVFQCKFFFNFKINTILIREQQTSTISAIKERVEREREEEEPQ